jgi:hypothetical protein
MWIKHHISQAVSPVNFSLPIMAMALALPMVAMLSWLGS